jgi:hypothetical protein
MPEGRNQMAEKKAAKKTTKDAQRPAKKKPAGKAKS